MYESEANQIALSSSEIPREVLARFAESRATVTQRTLIPWGEHCTECVWPTCYSTCDLYSPREDGRCRRFVDGMVRLDSTDTLNPYLLKVSFKRWGKLWSMANLKMYSLSSADRSERRDLRVASFIQAVPGQSLRAELTRKRYSMKKRSAMNETESDSRPNCLLIECYNPNQVPVSITLTVRSGKSPLPYQALLIMDHGFNRHRQPVGEIEKFIDLSKHFEIDLTPNEIPDGLTLYFGAMDFVIDTSFAVERSEPDSAASVSSSRICKCVVWDLDNTIWHGTLIEDGPENIRLKPGIKEILNELDERGILISAVSKNNYDDASALLHQFGIFDYFLFPQISWEPKSQGIRQIANSLNIGVDSLLFVDDSPFEREEVKSVFREVTVLDAAEYQSIPDRPDCQTAITEESRKRRSFYRDHERREHAQKDFNGEYFAFLRDCNLRLTVQPMTEANLQRVHELTQRTNQMNFSGNRYSREQLQTFLNNANVDTYVLDCADRFGSYGTIGFCIVNRSHSCMTDLMFSCRIQGKRVEHAFVSYILGKYKRLSPDGFKVQYRKTAKNAGPGKVFEDFGFEVVGEIEGVSHLMFPSSATIPGDGIVSIAGTTALSASNSN